MAKFDKRETEKLSAALTSLTNGFKANQLARELLKSKSESLLCDKLSDRLNALEDEPDIRVVREWENGKREGNRQRIDLAWLRGDRPVALIEAKVAKSFDLAVASDRCYPSKELRKDMDKLRSIGCGSSPYLLLFIVHNHGVPKSPQGCNIPYMKEMRRHGVIPQSTIQDGFERIRQKLGEVSVCTSGCFPAGIAFDVKVSVYFWLLSFSQ